MAAPARVTIRDVAAAAGVSVTTVSHSLSGKREVGAETRARVLRAAEQLGYRASRPAQALRLGRTATIALQLPDPAGEPERELLDLDYYMRVAAAAAGEAFARDHSLLLAPRIDSALDLQRLSIDGGILCDPSLDDARLSLFAQLGVPLVTIGRDLAHPEMRWHVGSDNDGNMRRLLDHLVDEGAQRIVLLATTSQWGWVLENVRAFEAWCAERRRPAPVEKADHPAHTYDVTRRLLGAPEPPDAIIALAEHNATAVVRAAGDMAAAVPDDLMVACGIDSRKAAEGDPPITAIEINPSGHGAAAAGLLIDLLTGREPAAPIVTPAELRIRASTRRRHPVGTPSGQ